MQVLTSSYGGIEGELLNVVRSVVLELNVDVNLLCRTGGNLRKGECTKNLVVKHLRATGYDAAVCKSKWEISSRLLGGSHILFSTEFLTPKKSEGNEHCLALQSYFKFGCFCSSLL